MYTGSKENTAHVNRLMAAGLTRSVKGVVRLHGPENTGRKIGWLESTQLGFYGKTGYTFQ